MTILIKQKTNQLAGTMTIFIQSIRDDGGYHLITALSGMMQGYRTEYLTHIVNSHAIRPHPSFLFQGKKTVILSNSTRFHFSNRAFSFF
jgi:hypothetical protein